MQGRKRLWPIPAMLLAGLSVLAAGTSAAPADDSTQPLELGVYDPDAVFERREDIQIEHIYVPWIGLDLSSLDDADDYAHDRGRNLQVTVEPWSWDLRRRVGAEQLKSGIFSGRYDDNMATICRKLGTLESDVTVRFAHEMNHHSSRYPWAGWPPEEYVRAYRRMIGVCRSVATGLRYMWSPLDADQFYDYYPGRDFVDVIGFSVFGYQRYDRHEFGRDRTFAEILKPGYDLAVNFCKPIVVAELGYTGDADYIARWDQSLRAAKADFPALTGIVYYYEKEVYPWPDGFGRPDWRKHNRRPDDFIDAIQNQLEGTGL